jgi:hypothetical protein
MVTGWYGGKFGGGATIGEPAKPPGSHLVVRDKQHHVQMPWPANPVAQVALF